MRQCGTDELDWSDEIRGDLMGDLFVAEFFGSTEEAISGIADNHVDMAKFGKGLIHDFADFR